MVPFAAGSWFIDVRYRDVAHLVACAVLETNVGSLLVDPGPAISMQTLEAGLAGGFQNVHGLLLTHIHLDHAGATGSLVAKYPHLKVYVHEIGARHMIRPDRLLASARRIYGDRMEATWGTFLAVPESNVVALRGGENLEIGGRRIRVAYTPGHASHHVCYLDEDSGTALAGDAAGMRVLGAPFIVPVAPPPDIDLELWRDSLAVLRDWSCERLFLTHFGPVTDVDWHLDEMAARLAAWAEAVRVSLGEDEPVAERGFHAREMAAMRRAVSGAARIPYTIMGQPSGSWRGLARYWRRVGPTSS